MDGVTKIDKIPEEYISKFGEAKTLFIGKALGSEKLYIVIDYLQPGDKSAKFHSHSMQEEFFMILSGTGTLRVNDENIEISPGFVFSKPAGKGIAHQFINTGTEVLEILDVGTIEKDDVATYPDEKVVYIRKDDLVFSTDDDLMSKGWTSNPNI